MEAFTQFGKYQILDRIAFGGMAELYRARIQGDRGFQKLVAVKKMHAHFAVDPEVVAAFIEEAKLAAFLQHPHIVQIYDFGCMEDIYFIVMEYLQGKDLRSLTTALEERQRPLGPENSLSIAASVCSGLEYAHRLTDMAGRPLRIVHRDISPQNIFVTYAGQVKILDFGIAKATDRGATTEAGVLKGKVAYMSPEQAQGRDIDQRSDLFAVGVILYELLTGRRLYQGNTMEILRLAQTGDFVPPEEHLADLTPELSHVFQHLLAVRPEDRFADAGAALAALEECLGDLSHRAIERHLADLVCDLFADDKSAEEEALKALTVDDTAPRTLDAVPDPDGSAPEPVEGPRRPAAASPSGTSLRKPRGRWLTLGLIGFLVAASLLMWVRWHVPGRGKAASLEAFEARRFGESALVASGDGRPAPGLADGDPAAEASPLERQARVLMDSDPLRARDLWTQVIDRQPNDIRAYFNLGLIHLRLEAYPPAIAAFERVLELAPDMIDARFNLGFAYAKVGRYQDAVGQYLQVADGVPEYLDEVLFNLAIVQDLLGDRQAAARSLHAAIRFNPHNVRAISYLARMEGRFSTPP
jgi:serine/threonine protein kinase